MYNNIVGTLKNVTTIGSKNVNVEWGGNWKMHDTPHFELK